MQISEAAGGVPAAGAEPCRFPKLEECAHFHYERVQLPQLHFSLRTNMDQSLHSQHTVEDDGDWHMVQVTSADECWLVQRNYENFKMLDAQLHQCIYDRKISQLPDLSSHPSYGEDVEMLLMEYLARLSNIADNSVNCGPVLNWFQMDNKGHRLLVPSEESRSINTPAVAAAYSVRRYVSQARDELNLEVGDMISVIDMASPAESMWWRGKRGFQVGFFPQHCVHIIGDKVPRNMPLPPPVVGSLAITPVKPVLRKHGKLIAFFRSFILNRPSRRRLKQSGILKERVFGCDLGEHLLNSGHDIPMVLKCCTEFIEKHGIVDGIYRLSGVTSNIQKLRNAFDEDRVPDLYTDEILQDIHSVASLLKMYFRELPNPLCTYQLYQSFVNAVQGCNSIARNSLSDRDRLLKMREAVQKLPPPHYRTLEYLMRHLSRVAQHGASTGMTTRNIAIVWAPNLLRCAELEVGGVAALQGVGVQAVVTEFLICYADLIFCDHLPSLNHANFDMDALSPKRSRPKSLAISTPTKLITLEEARTKHLLSKTDESGYIEVGGGPNNLPKKYHTVIELPAGSRKRGLSKRSPLGWRSFFSKSRSSSRSQGSLTKTRKASTPGNIATSEKSVTETDLTEMKRKLRPVKSAESLTSGHSEPASTEDVLGPLHSLNKPPGHNRSVSHDSYFDTLQTSQHNSEGSLYDLSEIQLNFELEESEMRIFSEDESLVSSPRVQKDGAYRRVLTRARPEDFNSTNNSNNPSPKKQARVVLSPDSTSRKRTRLEDQLSDIQYIDCNTPDNTCIISTTAVVHIQPETTPIESYQPKNKSPRSSEVENKRQSLDLEKPEKIMIPKSFTESNIRGKLIIPSNQSSAFASPQSPIYKQLENSSSNTTLLSPDFSPTIDAKYQNLTLDESEQKYENIVSPVTKKSSPTYENVLTTISITYRSPTKSKPSESDSIYEDVIVNLEQASIPTSAASLPLQQASQPSFPEKTSLNSLPANLTVLEKDAEQRPKSLSALEDFRDFNPTLKPPDKCLSLSPTPSYKPMENELSLTDLSLSEVVHSSTENISQSSISFPSPSKNSLSPNVSPMLFGDDVKTLSQDILTSLSPSVASLLESKTRHSSVSSLDGRKSSNSGNSEENENLACLRSDVRNGNPEYLKLTDNNISSNEEDVSPIRFPRSSPPGFSASDLNLIDMKVDLLDLESEYSNSETVRLDPEPTEAEPQTDEASEERDAMDEPPKELEALEEPLAVVQSRPVSVNLIEFSPVEQDNPRMSVNDKRKSCETEPMEDENSIYQQVKYFRRSVHEINALLDLDPAREEAPPAEDPKIDSEVETFDSLEVDQPHVYENVEAPPQGNPEPLQENPGEAPKPFQEVEEKVAEPAKEEKPSVRSLTSHFELRETALKPPIYRRVEKKTQEGAEGDSGQKRDFGSSSSLETPMQKIIYDRGSLPPCLRARHVKNAIKTRSLDEDAFAKECVTQERRKSVDDNFGSKLNTLPKSLNPPKPIPVEGHNDIHFAHSTENVGLPEQKLNRERIEKYKEERRKFLHDKYRSESFREDKDIFLARLKQKTKTKTIEDDAKPFEAKPPDAKSLNAKPPEAKCLNAKPPEAKCLNAKPPEPKCLNAKPPEAKCLNAKPPDAKPLSTKPPDAKPLSAKPPDAKPPEAEPKSGTRKKHDDFRRKDSGEFDRDSLECDSNLKERKHEGKDGAPIKESIRYKTALFEPPSKERKGVSVKETVNIISEGDFVRNRRRDEDGVKSEWRRHTYEPRERERKVEGERVRRISLENRSPRKEAKPPSYCIKDMKAIFESKSQQ